MKINFLAMDMDDACANSTMLRNNWIKRDFKITEDWRESRKNYMKEFGDGLEAVFPSKAKLVSDIIAKTGAMIVWTSDWRLYSRYNKLEDAVSMFNRRGLPGNSLIGYTPDLTGYGFTPRSEEINSFIRRFNQGDYLFNENGEHLVGKVAVVDDRVDAGVGLIKNCKFFKCSNAFGLTAPIKDKVIKFLSE